VTLLGEIGDIMKRSHQEKFENNFRKILQCDNLSSANDFAEECLSLLPTNEYFQLLPGLRRQQGIKIDPVYTLLERLIVLGEVERADCLSRHYLCLMGTTEYCLPKEDLKDPPD
jgi:1-aminocyclopropane-1-carboxylate deaminase/D-cysteine desulfhydrase-like pyridoxal-dependent ACC family enzyme